MKNSFLEIAGLINLLLALFHIIMIFIGAPAYLYFGAGEQMVTWAEEGSAIPAILTLLVAMVFLVFALYAFSGAQLVRPLPYLNWVLKIITAIYLIRGLAVVPEIFQMIQSYAPVLVRETISSLVSLSIGLIHLLGIRHCRKNLAGSG